VDIEERVAGLEKALAEAWAVIKMQGESLKIITNAYEEHDMRHFMHEKHHEHAEGTLPYSRAIVNLVEEGSRRRAAPTIHEKNFNLEVTRDGN
jgi:hypothetical protein